MRKYVLLVTALIAAIAVAAVAQAAVKNKQTADLQFTPSVAGTKKKPRNASVRVNITTTNGESASKPPSAVKHVVLKFPPSGRWNGAKFPKCPPAIFMNNDVKACPKGSLVGKGKAEAWLGTTRIVHLNIYSFTDGNKLQIYVEGIDIGIFVYLTATIVQKASGITVDVPIPETVREAVPNTKTPLIKFVVPAITGQIKKAGKKINLIETTSCPKGNKYTISSTFTSEDNITQTVKATHPCTQGK